MMIDEFIFGGMGICQRRVVQLLACKSFGVSDI